MDPTVVRTVDDTCESGSAPEPVTKRGRVFLSDAMRVTRMARDYLKRGGHISRIVRPRTFHEKVLFRMMFDRRQILTAAADKLSARAYAQERLGEGVLTPLLAVVADPAAIPFERLPDRFVLKPSHASGFVAFVTNQSSVNRAELLSQCGKWLRVDYSDRHGEWAYRHARRRIMVEGFIDDGTGKPPRDYKFFVFGGRVAMIQVDADRFSGHRRSLFDRSWKCLPITYNHKPVAEEDALRPRHLDEMLAAAECLGNGVDFLRADFYDTPKQIYFGEITMTPGAATGRFSSDEFDSWLGSLWRMPSILSLLRGHEE